VPTKNAAEYLVVVLDSILSQDYPNIECVVIDGGSTDATLDILANYGDQIMWTTQPDRGAFDAINRGWQTSRGQILAWLNADDSWTPGAVSAAIKCFQDDPDADLVYGDCLIVDAEGRELERRRPPDWDLAYAVESCHHIIDQPAAFIRRSMVERVGWLYPAWFHDWDLWRRISLAGGKIKRVPHLLGCARVRVDNSQYRPDILVNGLVALTKRFFSLPGVPAEFQELRRRALSNCYLKIMQTLQYGRPESRALRLSLCLRALAADPSNLRNVLKTTPGGRRALPATSEREDNLEKMKPPTQCSFTFATVQAMQEKPIHISNVQDRPEPLAVVSVVVPCKNDARYLPSALESILSQDYPHLECIVMDGGSTDGTLDLLERYGDRIRWQSEPDRGAFDAISRGWQLSKGEILTWLNADDLWVPGAVRTAVEVFEGKPEVDVVFGTAGVIDELGRVHGDLVPDSWDLERALREGFHIIFQPASFMRRRILEEVGWLYPAWCHDHDLWLRIARAGGTFEKIPVRLAMDRLRTENLGQLADLVVPAKIGLTKRFFAEPGLPPNLQQLRRRALSSTYVRAVDYLQVNQPRHWLWAVRLLAHAMITDPLNIRAVGERATRPFRERSMRLLSSILNSILTRMFGMGKRLLRLIAALMGALRRSLGRVVERVFVRGNRELTLKIDSLQQRVAAAERVASAALEPVASRVDRIAEDVSRLTDGLESLRRQDEARIAAVERAIPEALQLIAARLADRIAQDRVAVVDTLETLRRQHEVRIAGLEDRIAQDRVGIEDALESLRLQHEALRKDLEVAQERPPKLSDVLSEIYGTPPTLRPIPGWHTYWGVENGSNRFLVARNELWSSLKRPVLMRWLGDLLVMIWPGNELSRVLFLTGNFEPNELTWMSQTLAEGMTMIDIGAHMGMYTMTASKLVGESGVVVALEPSTREFQRLTFHVTLNELRNVRCFQLAASSASGEAMLKIASEWNSGHNTFGEFFNPEVEMTREERVPTQTVDALVAGQGLERIDVIKIDVEGHELQVLAGAVETLTRFRPRVLIEVFAETLCRQGASVEAVLGFLTGHGYVLNEFSDVDGGLVPLSRSPGNESRNLVALPK
jgi:FkbM family methyltransferase